MKTKSIVRKGPSTGRGNTDFITVKEDEPVTIVPIVGTGDILSIDLHAFWQVNPAVTFACLAGTGEDCPGCDLGDKPGYRAFLPVVDSEGEMKIFPFGISVERQLTTLEDELGDIIGLKLRVRRTGSGLKTKYQIINTGKSIEIEYEEKDALKFVESKIEVKEVDTILEQLRDAGLVGGGKPKKSAKAAETEEDESELEEEEAEEKSVKKAVKKPIKEEKPVKKIVKGKKVKDEEEW